MNNVLSILLKFFNYVVVAILLSNCIAKNDVELKLKNPKKKSSLHETLNISVSNIQVVNNQVVITGTNLLAVEGFQIKEGLSNNNLEIESQTSTTLIANTKSNVTFAAGKVLDFIFSSAEAASTFTVNFSLCDSLLGGKGFDCTVTPTDKQVLSYDAASGKWKPRNVNGLNYIGSWDANDPLPAATEAGEYYIVSIANGIYSVGDWIVFNGISFDKIDNSQSIVSVFGRTGAITANLNDMSDVLITSPANGQVLKYNGTKWVNGAGTEIDPNVSAFAKTTLPTCGAGEVLKADGTTITCVTDNAGAGSFAGSQNRLVITDGTIGALTTSSVTSVEAGYLSGVTSNIQTQLSSKLNSSSYIDWSTTGVQTIDPTRINLTTANRVIVTNGTLNPVASSVTTTELGYLTGVTSNIQTQLNAKMSSFTESDPSVSAFAKTTLPTCNAGEVLKSNGTTFSCVTDNAGAGSFTGTQNRLVLTDGSTGALTTSTITNVEAGYLSGVTSSIQTQINSKQATITQATIQDISKLRIYGANPTNYVELSVGTLTGNRSLIFPDSNGTSGEVLSTNGSGVLSWIPIPSAPVTSVNSQTGAVSLTTSNISEGSNLYFTPARAKSAAVADSIADAIIDVAPSQNAVFDALGLKLNSSGFIPWDASGLQTIHPSRLSLGLPNASKALVTDASGFITASSVTGTQLGYLGGVTSNIQTQLDTKQSIIDKTTTQDVGKVRIYGANTTNYVELTAATLTGNRSLIFPDSDGTNGQVLSTNGSGTLSWITPANISTSASLVTNTPNGNIAATNVQTAINELDTEKQNVSTFAADVRAVVLTGLSIGTNAAIVAADSLLVALGKLQTQISSKADQTNVSQTITAAAVTGLNTPSAGTDAVNKDYVDGFGQWTKGTGANSGDIYRSSGNIGIGTGTPRNSLDVIGGIRTLPGSPVNDGANYGYSFGANGDTGMYFVNNTNGTDGDIAFYSNSSPKLTILSGGNVGIGTTGPTTKLEVSGSSGSTLKIIDGNQADGKVLTSDSTGSASWKYNGGLANLTGSVSGSTNAAANTSGSYYDFPGGPYNLSLPSAGTYFISEQVYILYGSGCGDVYTTWAGSNIVNQSLPSKWQACGNSGTATWEMYTFVVTVSAATTITARYSWTNGGTGSIMFGAGHFIKIGQ